MFAYCGNEPVGNADPSGYAWWGTNTVAISDCRFGFTPGYAEYVTAPDRKSRKKRALVQNFVGILNAMATPTSDGATFSAGLTVSTNYDGSGGAWSGVISSDGGSNYAIQTSNTYSSSTCMGTSAGLVMTWTNARYVTDLEVDSTIYGGTVVNFYGISADYISFIPASEPQKQKWGISISILVGAGAEAHMGQSYTTTVGQWNPIIALINAITGG